MTRPYPIMFNLAGRLAVVVGGGAVGRRKVEGLLAAGARVRVVDPKGGDWPSGVEVAAEPYHAAHLDGAILVFACTNDRTVNAKVAADAKAAGVPVNIADDPAACDFTLPAVHRTESLTLAVATDAGVPALAAHVRDRLADHLSAELDAFAAAVAESRGQLKTTHPAAARRRAMNRLCGPEGWAAFQQEGSRGLANLLRELK